MSTQSTTSQPPSFDRFSTSHVTSVGRFLANLVAVFGEFDISGEVESKRSISKNVRRVIVHRQYDAATFENDIALLELESPVQFDSHIVPICMPEDDEDFTGRMATVTGWGRLKYGKYFSTTARRRSSSCYLGQKNIFCIRIAYKTFIPETQIRKKSQKI